MRALSVRQPWAWQIVNQRKNIENRTRNFVGQYRGPVIIQAALKADEYALRRLPMRPPPWVTAPRVFDYGVVLGVVDLIDVHEAFADTGQPVQYTACGSECGDWAQPGPIWHLVLANPRPIPLFKQFKVRGALGLWTPTDDVVERVREAIR